MGSLDTDRVERYRLLSHYYDLLGEAQRFNYNSTGERYIEALCKVIDVLEYRDVKSE